MSLEKRFNGKRKVTRAPPGTGDTATRTGGPGATPQGDPGTPRGQAGAGPRGQRGQPRGRKGEEARGDAGDPPNTTTAAGVCV